MTIINFEINSDKRRIGHVVLDFNKCSCTDNRDNRKVCEIQNNFKCLSLRRSDSGDFIRKKAPTKLRKTPVLRIDGYLLRLLINELIISKKFRTNFLHKYEYFLKNHCCQEKLKIRIYLQSSNSEFIDYKWNEKLTLLCLERQELDFTMSWLSTLGGAFSALGDHFINCAEIAGKISLQQFKLAMRIGDPLTVARCKLYLSLSLVQREKFRLAKYIILEQYNLAKSNSIIDYRLINMCKGIWAKLKYEKKIYKLGQLNKKGRNSLVRIQ